MRTYGRVNGVWQEVDTDANGFNDAVYVTTLIQCFKLNLNESPFYGQFGIPAKEAVIQQVLPDFYVYFMQQYFSQFFASLTVAKLPLGFPPVPTYRVNITTQAGSKLAYDIPE